MTYSDRSRTLAHYGVKGMKWGVTRDEATLRRIGGQRTRAVGGTKEERKALSAQAKSDWKKYKDSTTRKERRQDRHAVKESKLQYNIDQVMKNPEKTLVNVQTALKYPVVVTGKEYLTYVSNGGPTDPMRTEIVGILGDEKRS